MKYLFKILLLILFLSACNNDKEIVQEQITIINVDNKNYELRSNSFYGNTNCNSIFAHLDYESKTDLGFRLAFILNKKGAVSKVKLVTYQNMVTIYESADFNSASIFKISNFSYKPESNFVSFDFEGDLFKVNDVIDEIDNVHLRKYIKGKFSMSNIQDIACGFFPDDLNFSTNDFNFSTTRLFKTTTTSSTSSVFETQFYSENGYQISFQNTTDLWNVPLGTYNFTTNSIQNKISCKKFIGNPRATAVLLRRDIDWKIMQTAGNYIITEKLIIRGNKVIKGTFDMKILENGMEVHDIKNASFSITGF